MWEAGGFFAALRMTAGTRNSRNELRQEQKQILRLAKMTISKV